MKIHAYTDAPVFADTSTTKHARLRLDGIRSNSPRLGRPYCGLNSTYICPNLDATHFRNSPYLYFSLTFALMYSLGSCSPLCIVVIVCPGVVEIETLLIIHKTDETRGREVRKGRFGR